MSKDIQAALLRPASLRPASIRRWLTATGDANICRPCPAPFVAGCPPPMATAASNATASLAAQGAR